MSDRVNWPLLYEVAASSKENLLLVDVRSFRRNISEDEGIGILLRLGCRRKQKKVT